MVKEFAMLLKKASKYTDKVGDGDEGEEKQEKLKECIFNC